MTKKTQSNGKRTAEDRLYLKRGRYYADFRDYAEVGGRKEAVRPPGSRNATDDHDEALNLVGQRVEELERFRQNSVTVSDARDVTTLGGIIEHHLEQTALRTNITSQWLGVVDVHLTRAEDFFGSSKLLRDIQPRHIGDYATYLANLRDARVKNGSEARNLSPATQRKHLNSLNQLFTRAIELGVLPMGQNPVAALMNKPVGEIQEADWLEVYEVALALRAAELYQPKRTDIAVPFIYEILATIVLTGGRKAEVLGLEVSDIGFARKTVTFRPKSHRRLKNPGSSRPVPLWPQLEEVLRAYLDGPHAPKGRLLFPSPKNPNKPVQELDKILDEIAVRMDRPEGLRTRALRHSYCTTRLQTLDKGAPVSKFTVGRELGHGGVDLVERIYGHLGTFTPRKEVVEYRIDEFRDSFGDRLAALEVRSAERNDYDPRSPNLHNRVHGAVEAAVLIASTSRPTLGPRPIAKHLREQGLEISPSGVRSIWVRHGLTKAAERREAAASGALEATIKELQDQAAS